MTYFGLNNLVNKNRNFIKIKHSFMDSLIMKGRGNATNVPELELIEQVRIRPVLYDKNVKDYRKVSSQIQFLKGPLKLFLFLSAAKCPRVYMG